MFQNKLKNLFTTTNNELFEELVWEAFHYQANNCQVYKAFIEYLGISHNSVNNITDIPFLPIELFKQHKIISANSQNYTVFESSGTTGQIPSKHYVADTNLYDQIALAGFQTQYESIDDYCVLALLPSYIERGNSSLVHMVSHFIDKSNHPNSGFYLDNLKKLTEVLNQNESSGIKTLLIGVSFALLNLAEEFSLHLENTVVMETGGMKGRRKELTREELHQIFKTAFSVSHIHSEYGMTELLSQAYSKGDGIFKPIPSMKVILRDVNDPLSNHTSKSSGGINVIDLANINSCSFIATSDLGKLYDDGTFEVLGRYDHSDTRGCNLMVL